MFDSVSPFTLIFGLVPVFMLFLSAGVAWGITKATIKRMDTAISKVTSRIEVGEENFRNWQRERQNALVSAGNCTTLREKCSERHVDSLNSLTNKLERYTEKADARWEELSISIGVITATQKEKCYVSKNGGGR